MLLNSGETTTTRDYKLCYAFHEVNGELYVVLGPDEALEVADIQEDWNGNTKSACVFKLGLKDGVTAEQASIKDNAKEVATNAIISRQIDRHSIYATTRFSVSSTAHMLRNEEVYDIALHVPIWHDEGISNFTNIQRVAKLPEPALA